MCVPVAVMTDWQITLKSDRAVHQQVPVEAKCLSDDHDDPDIELMFPALEEGRVTYSIYYSHICRENGQVMFCR